MSIADVDALVVSPWAETVNETVVSEEGLHAHFDALDEDQYISLFAGER